MILDFRYSDEEDLALDAPVGAAASPPQAEYPARRRSFDLRPVGDVVLALAIGAMPRSELRRMLDSLAQAVVPGSTDAVDVCGGEDSGCTSFLDRYLGGGVDPGFADDAELFNAI